MSFKPKILLSFIILAILSVSIALLLTQRPNPADGFWSVVDICPEDLEDISIQYGDVTAPLTEADQKRLVQALDEAVFTSETQESEPLTPSEYPLIFRHNGEETALIFYWFSGIRPLDQKTALFEYVDRRFDIIVGSTRYIFTQSEDSFWNEEISRLAFNNAAAASQQPLRYQLDGYDFVSVGNYEDPSIPGISWFGASAEELIQASDQVVIATCTGYEPLSAGLHRGNHWFEIDTVIKGDEHTGSQLTIWQWQYGDGTAHDGRKFVSYPPVCLPFFEKGTQYLLCLQGNSTDGYVITGGPFGSGVIYEEIVYPRYNTLYHPFYHISIADLSVS